MGAAVIKRVWKRFKLLINHCDGQVTFLQLCGMFVIIKEIVSRAFIVG